MNQAVAGVRINLGEIDPGNSGRHHTGPGYLLNDVQAIGSPGSNDFILAALSLVGHHVRRL